MKSVLCVEDDRFIGEMYVRSMVKAGYQVDWVLDGGDGMAAVKSKSYDFILVDLMLPNKRGDEVVHELRSDEEDKVPNAKIVVLTNYQQDTDSRLLIERKVDAYLIKADITPKRLLQTLARLGGIDFDGK